MSFVPRSKAELEMRRRWNLADGDPGPVSLPKMLFPEDHARRLDEARWRTPGIAPEREEYSGIANYATQMSGGEGSDDLAGGAGDDGLTQRARNTYADQGAVNPIDRNVDEKYLVVDGKYKLNPYYDPPFDITLGQAIGIPPLIGAAAALAPGAVAAIGSAYRFARHGGELKINPNLEIAPFGNRTNHPTGKWPHYHRRPSMDPPPGQGMKRHRPWDKKEEFDKNWRDRF